MQEGVWGGGEQHHHYPRRTVVAFGTGNLKSGVKSTPLGIETQFCQCSLPRTWGAAAEGPGGAQKRANVGGWSLLGFKAEHPELETEPKVPLSLLL